MGVFLPDNLLTGIVAQAPYLGTPLGRIWGGEDLSDSPTFDAYIGAVGNNRQRLLLQGHTGFLGGEPFVHRGSRVATTRVIPPLPKSKNFLDDAASPGFSADKLREELVPADTANEQLVHAVERGNILMALEALGRLERLGSRKSFEILLHQVACEALDRRGLEKKITDGNLLSAYYVSQIGLHVLGRLFKLAGLFPYAGSILREMISGEKGILIFNKGGKDSGRFDGARVENGTHPAVAKEILEILGQLEDRDRQEGVRLLQYLAEKMNYKFREAKIFDVTIEEMEIVAFPMRVNCTEAIYDTAVKWGLGDLFLRLVHENPETADVAFNRPWEGRVLQFKSDWCFPWIRGRVEEDPGSAHRFMRINSPKVSDAVRAGLEKALKGPRFARAIEIILFLYHYDRCDWAAQILIDRHKELSGHPDAQSLIADAMEKTGAMPVILYFEAERNALPFWSHRERRVLSARIARTKAIQAAKGRNRTDVD